VLHFSQAMDPHFVNENTIQFRTASGALPVGDFLVNGNIVEFVPKVLTIGAQSFFGFAAGETYTMTLPGGLDERNAVRGTSGDPLAATTSCTLRVTRGIIDLNGVPPSARLIRPTVTVGVPRDSVIQLGFNELIDATPFLQATPGNGPVRFEVARSADLGGPTRSCLNEYTALVGQLQLDLLPQLPDGIGALLTFTPAPLLPGSSCVRITVSDQVHDLSGRAANIQIFELQTEVVPTVEESVIETFDDDAKLDPNVSSGDWLGGRGHFATIGGDGRHGSFDFGNAQQLARLLTAGTVTDITPTGASIRTLQLNVDNTFIPPTNTISGTQATVTDGRYFLTEFVVPAATRLVFIGSHAPQFTVRGRIQIDGSIEANGTSLPFPGIQQPPPLGQPEAAYTGQAGGTGGVFGGNGGNGGSRCLGTGPRNVGGVPTGLENGRDGQDCHVDASHAYAAQTVGTGGRGALMFPAHGLSSQISFPTTQTAYAMEAAAGGGGGGFSQPGGVGQCIRNSRAQQQLFMGPPSQGGIQFSVLPLPTNARSSLHFLVGGSGGGGGASHPALVLNTLLAIPTTNASIWGRGLGGGGGGGAIALRSGKSLRISATGRVSATGGAAASTSTGTQILYSQSGPAGGGSGGSVVVQCAEVVQLLGVVTVQGGGRGLLDLSAPAAGENGGVLQTAGGDGSPGFIRLERPGATTADLPNALPPIGAQNIGELTEVDTRVAFQSRFYPVGHPFAPEYVRYEIVAVIDGQPVTFSDDLSIGVPARAGFGPLEAFWQGATVDGNGILTESDLSSRPWRSLVGGPTGLNADGRNAFRFQLIVDRTNGQVVEIDSVKVVFRI